MAMTRSRARVPQRWCVGLSLTALMAGCSAGTAGAPGQNGGPADGGFGGSAVGGGLAGAGRMDAMAVGSEGGNPANGGVGPVGGTAPFGGQIGGGQAGATGGGTSVGAGGTAGGAGGAPMPAFDRVAVMSIMRLVANYEINRFGTDNSNGWVRSTFHAGMLAAYAALGDAKYHDYTQQWGQANAWLVSTDNSSGPRFADNQTCFQSYAELYVADPVAANNVMIASAQTVFDSIARER
jgi:Glycosyl Hydrolase Family 88